MAVTTTSQAMAAAIDMFRAQGIKVTKEMTDALAAQQIVDMSEAAEKVVTHWANEDVDAPAWVDVLFNLALDINASFRSESRSVQGRGNTTREVTPLTVETPHGTLSVKLSR